MWTNVHHTAAEVLQTHFVGAQREGNWLIPLLLSCALLCWVVLSSIQWLTAGRCCSNQTPNLLKMLEHNQTSYIPMRIPCKNFFYWAQTKTQICTSQGTLPPRRHIETYELKFCVQPIQSHSTKFFHETLSKFYCFGEIYISGNFLVGVYYLIAPILCHLVRCFGREQQQPSSKWPGWLAWLEDLLLLLDHTNNQCRIEDKSRKLANLKFKV